jgi:hypothetical protein
MIYDLSMPRKDFDQADAVVRDVTRTFKPRTLNRITQNLWTLSFENRKYIETSIDNPLGVTFLDHETNEFDIWLSPSFRYWDSPWSLDTVLHELSHGYGAMHHGQLFRRTFIKVLHRYETEVQPVKADFMARRMVNRYSEDSWEARQLELDFCKKAALKESKNAQALVSV